MRKILVVHDHALIRSGVKQSLELAREMGCDQAADAAQAGAMIEREEYLLVLLAPSLPDDSEYRLLKTLGRERPKLPVLMLALCPDDAQARQVLRLGARGYACSKETSVDELTAAVEAVLSGACYLSRSVAERLAFPLRPGIKQPARHETLSGRESQVLGLMGQGRSASEIGAELQLSVKTVSTYRTRLLAKLGLRNNAELIGYAIKSGLLN